MPRSLCCQALGQQLTPKATGAWQPCSPAWGGMNPEAGLKLQSYPGSDWVTLLRSLPEISASLSFSPFPKFASPPSLTGFFFTNHLYTAHHLRAAIWGIQLRYSAHWIYMYLKISVKTPTYCDQSQWITKPHLSLPPTISIRNANILLVTQTQSFGEIFKCFFFT